MESQNDQEATRAQAQGLDFIIDQQGRVLRVRQPDAGAVQAGSGRTGAELRLEPRYRVVMIPIGLFVSLFALIASLLSPEHRAVSSFNAGNDAYDAQSYDQAIAKYDEAIRLKFGFGEAYNNRGLAYRAKGNNELALADFDQAIKFMSWSPEAYNNRGLVYHAMGAYDQAIADFSQALEHGYFDTAEAYDNRGVTYWYKDDYDKAIADFDAAIRTIVSYRLNLPSDPEPHEADTADAVDQRIDERLTEFQTYGELPSVYAHRGLAYLANDDFDRAFSDLDRAIKLQPTLAVAYYLRGVAYRAAGDYERAIDDFQQVIELDNNPNLQQEAEYQLLELGVELVNTGS